jgi:hypothetical protein
VEKVQAGYKVQPLSAFLHQPPPPTASNIDFVPRCQPMTVAGLTMTRTSAQRDQQRRSVALPNSGSRLRLGASPRSRRRIHCPAVGRVHAPSAGCVLREEDREAWPRVVCHAPLLAWNHLLDHSTAIIKWRGRVRLQRR